MKYRQANATRIGFNHIAILHNHDNVALVTGDIGFRLQFATFKIFYMTTLRIRCAICNTHDLKYGCIEKPVYNLYSMYILLHNYPEKPVFQH